MDFILILLIIFGVYAFYQRKKGKSWKSLMGLAIIFLAVLFIEPSPDPLTFGAYLSYKGIEFSSINASNLPAIIFNFEIWSILIGVFLLFIGIWVYGIKPKKILEKVNLGRFNLCVGLSFLVVILISYFNIVNWTTILIISAIVPLIYFTTYRKDKSEAFALLTVPPLLILFGLKDLLRFIFDKIPIPELLPNLNNPIVSWISVNLGFVQVNNISLVISVFISFIIVFLYVKVLKERF
ncbi:MAG: hypothetical protein KKB31_05105 [Nanoarchaeota archaeon]|nr:hypothetical protein [Nanoarchaeota archaeon]